MLPVRLSARCWRVPVNTRLVAISPGLPQREAERAKQREKEEKEEAIMRRAVFSLPLPAGPYCLRGALPVCFLYAAPAHPRLPHSCTSVLHACVPACGGPSRAAQPPRFTCTQDTAGRNGGVPGTVLLGAPHLVRSRPKALVPRPPPLPALSSPAGPRRRLRRCWRRLPRGAPRWAPTAATVAIGGGWRGTARRCGWKTPR